MGTRGREGETRERILVEASALFAERGYHGTSTRDIARAVGIRQPSLYSHFGTKHEILAELLDADLRPALERITAARQLDAPVAVRLHAYLHSDVAAILQLPYDVRGLYNDDVLQLPELQQQARRRAEMHRATTELVAEGVAAGELTVSDPGFVQHAITGLLLEAIRERGARPSMDPFGRAGDVADFVLRAILSRPESLPEVRAASADLLLAPRDEDPSVAGTGRA
jgi:AcrR family transcriptional regulator